MADSAPHLAVFTIVLLLLMYGYEIFNFSLSIDEELYGSGYEGNWSLLAISQGRWTMGLLDWVFPPLGNIPMLSTVLFCATLGVSACLLARVLFRNHSAQLAFVGIFISFPLWPHLAEFNVSSWMIGIGCLLLTLSFLLFLAERRIADIGAACLITFATGIYQSLFTLFLVLVCLRHLSDLLGMAPVRVTESQKRLPWLRSGLVVAGGLLGYLAVERLLLAGLSLKLTYVQGYVRLADFTAVPATAIARTLQRSWNLLVGSEPMFFRYGHVLTLLSLLGLLIVVVRLVWRGPLRPSQRLLAGMCLAAAFVLALGPLVVSAGTVPTRGLTSWIPVSAFLAGAAFSQSSRFVKPLYVVLAASLLISVWISVSLFYTDHLARQRDQVLATRIMTRVDQVLPNPPPGRIPFVIIGANPARKSGAFRKLEVFGDSFFDSSHEGGNPYRIAAYLRTIGVDTLEPHPLTDADAFRSVIEAMPVWPAAGSVAVVNGMLVIKLGP